MNNSAELLGALVRKCRGFRISIPLLGIYRPKYLFAYADLDINSVIGYIEPFDIKQALTLIQLSGITYEDFEGMDISRVTGIPILHSGDDRNVEDLVISEIVLKPQHVRCIFTKET